MTNYTQSSYHWMVSCPTCRATVLIALAVALAGGQRMIDISQTINDMIGRHMIAELALMTTHEMTIELLVMSEDVVICEFNPEAGADRSMTRIKLACAAPATPKKKMMMI
jgi:hypothetical protein